MRLLLDSHAFLWFVLNDSRLSATAKAKIASPANEILVSPASYWEIAIKVRLGKLALKAPFDPFVADQIAINRFTILHIEPRHAAVLTTLPLHHRDPFDRLLVAQALAEQIEIVSNDPKLDLYGITRIW
jgi:PIN domain nuclease of toxin-antitoxin system